MTTRVAIERVGEDKWQEIAPCFLDYNFRQCWQYGQALATLRGAVTEHIVVWRGENCIAAADVRLKRIPVMGGGLAYISGAPMTRKGRGDDIDALSCALEALVQEYVKKRGMILRLFLAPGPQSWMDEARSVFRQLDFSETDSVRIYRTFLLDISGSEEKIRKNLAQKWRNCLNRAEKNGLEVRSGTDRETFEPFRQLYNDFIQRKEFQCDLDADFYADLQANLPDSEKNLVTLVMMDGRPIAGHMGSLLGDTGVYLLGASSEESLKQKAAYLLQWHFILEAKRRGLRWYDLGGTDPGEAAGVHKFKAGLGGEDIVSPGPFEMVPRGLKGKVATTMESAYRSLRG